MRILGWILLILGILSFIGAASQGNSIIGPVFFGGLGAYLLSRVNKKKQEEHDKDKWINGHNV